MIEKIDHLGIVVKDLDASIAMYKDILGLEYIGREVVPDGTVEVAFFNIGESKIELITPVNNPGVDKFLEKRGEGLHHICVATDNIEKDLADMKAKGARLIDQEPRPGAHGKKIAFVHPQSVSGVLIELSQDDPDHSGQH